MAAAQKRHPDLAVEEIGDASANKAVNETIGDDVFLYRSSRSSFCRFGIFGEGAAAGSSAGAGFASAITGVSGTASADR